MVPRLPGSLTPSKPRSNPEKSLLLESGILKIAKTYGAKTIKRPKDLAKDKTFKIDVIRHAVNVIERKDFGEEVSIKVSIDPKDSKKFEKLFLIENSSKFHLEK